MSIVAIIAVLATCSCVALTAWISCILTKCEDEARGMIDKDRQLPYGSSRV